MWTKNLGKIYIIELLKYLEKIIASTKYTMAWVHNLHCPFKPTLKPLNKVQNNKTCLGLFYICYINFFFNHFL